MFFTSTNLYELFDLSLKQLIIQKTRLSTYGDRVFNAVEPKLWCSLPLELKNANSYHNFKAALRTFIFRKACRL